MTLKNLLATEFVCSW